MGWAMNATQGWKDNTHYRPTHTHSDLHAHTWKKTHAHTHHHHHGSGIYFYLDAKSMWNAWWVMMMWRFGAASWMEEPHMALSVRVITLLRLWLPFRERKRGRERERKTEREGERARLTQDHATTEIVWGQQCHNYFKMSACNKIQQFIWQKAN